MENQRTVIIGGGVAGLAAALKLAESGQGHPIVLEKEEKLGGLARSLHFKGFSSDLGPHRIHTEIPEVMPLIERVAGPSLMTVKRQSHIYLRGKYLPYPPSPLAMTLHLGPIQMTRFGMSYGLELLGSKKQEPTYESIMKRAFGGALYDFLLKPYSEKTWKTDPAQLHADTARVRVSAGSLAKMVSRLFRREKKGEETSLKEFRYVRGGVETLVAHLAEHARQAGARLEVESPVERLELNEDGAITDAVVGWRDHGERKAGPKIETDMVLSTIPLPLLLERLLPRATELADARDAAEGLHYLNMIFVLLIVRRRSITRDNWLYFPEPGLIFNRAYEAKNMDPAMGPEDQSVINFELTLREGDPRWQENDDALIDEVRRQAASTGLFKEDEVVEGLVYRLPYAYPLYLLDYDQRLERVFAGLRRIPNLITLGRQGLFNHNNMDHSIFMGLKAAETLQAAATPRQAVERWYDEAGVFKTLRIVD